MSMEETPPLRPSTVSDSGSAAEGYRKVSSPYGFSMLDVEASAGLERVSRAAQDIVRAEGYERVMPATIDFPDTFAPNSHAEMFSMKDNSGERLALRNDITAQVIKGYVRQIERRDGQNLRRFYYAAPVYKDIRKNYPLPREIYQLGCEVIGDKADTELPRLIALSGRILSEVFSLQAATQVCDVRFRNAFAALAGSQYADAERRRDTPLLREILINTMKVPADAAKKLALWLFYPAAEVNPPESAALPKEMRDTLAESSAAVKQLIEATPSQKGKIFWQPLSEPRSIYYSGLFFETYVPGFTEPLVRGGVYNELVKRYADLEAGACGFALDLLKY